MLAKTVLLAVDTTDTTHDTVQGLDDKNMLVAGVMLCTVPPPAALAQTGGLDAPLVARN